MHVVGPDPAIRPRSFVRKRPGRARPLSGGAVPNRGFIHDGSVLPVATKQKSATYIAVMAGLDPAIRPRSFVRRWPGQAGP